MKKNKKMRIVFTGLIFLVLSFLFSIYLYQMNVYGDFSLEITNNGKNISHKFEVFGKSILGREQKLLFDSVNNNWNNFDNWYFKKIIIKNETCVLNMGDSVKVLIKNCSNNNLIYHSFEYSDLKNDVKINWIYDSFDFFNRAQYMPIIGHLFHFKIVFLLFVIITISIIIIIFLPNSNLYKILIFDAIDIIISPKTIRIFRYSIYLLIILLGLFLRFSTPTTTILGFDHYGHARSVVMFFEYGSFDRYEMAYPYPVFLILILSVFKNLNAIVIIQHILSALSVIGFIFFIEYKFKKIRIYNRNMNLVLTISTILFIFILFLNDKMIFLEKNLHHEGLIIPSSLVSIFLIFLYFKNKHLRRRIWLFTITIVVLFVFSLMHYRLMAGFISVSLIILYYEVKILRRHKKNIFIPIAIFVVSLILIYGPDKYFINKYDKMSKAFPYTQFVYSNANTVIKAINQNQTVIPAYDTTVFINNLNIVTSIGAHRWDNISGVSYYNYILGYHFDYLKYELELPVFKRFIAKTYFDFYEDNYFMPTNCQKNEYARLYNNYYKGWAKLIIVNYPVDVLIKIFRQIGHLFFSIELDFMSFDTETTMISPYNSNMSITNDSIIPYLPFTIRSKLLDNPNICIDFLIDNNYIPEQKIVIQYPDFMKLIYMIAFLFRILLFINLVYLFFMLCKRKTSFFLFSLFIMITSSILTVAVFHTFDIPRYFHALLPMILCMMLFTVIEHLKYTQESKI